MGDRKQSNVDTHAHFIYNIAHALIELNKIPNRA